MDTIRKKLLMISDSVSCTSGLGRITRDLATRIHADIPEIEIATAGYGGSGSRRFGFKEYHFHSVENWLLPELPQIAHDFAGDEELTIMFCWDLSRVYWFADPKLCQMAHLRQWLMNAKIKKWIYHPVDAEGPLGKLSGRLAETMKGFDRVLDYSAFSCRVTGNTEHLPHGIDIDQFKPYDRIESKRRLRELGFPPLQDDSFLIGIVATNQARKDWALGVETCRILLDRGLDVKLWCHIDVLERFWSLPNLIADYGLQNRVVLTNANFTDEQMARMYSACDVTLGIGLGEGFGYSTFESLACGTPTIGADYSATGEHLKDSPEMLIKPKGWRYEGAYCCKRPVFDPIDWADAAQVVWGHPKLAQLPSNLDWNNLWPRWKSWFLEGVK